MENNSKLINVLWTGPFSLDEILKENVINGKGLYQIYGTHLIYGRNVLLYIGQTEVSFLERFQKHKSEWIKFEFDNVQIYSGEIIKSNDLNEDLKNAEKLLLYFCAPAYNSNSIFDLKISPAVLHIKFLQKFATSGEPLLQSVGLLRTPKHARKNRWRKSLQQNYSLPLPVRVELLRKKTMSTAWRKQTRLLHITSGNKKFVALILSFVKGSVHLLV